MFGSASWNLSRSVKALIAVGLAMVGAVLVWAALARPSTPDAALAPAPNDQSALSTSPSARKPSPERSTAGADQTNLHDQTKGLVLPESEPVAVSIPRIGVQSRLVELGLMPMERWRRHRPCRRWLVLSRARTGCTRAGRHRRARHLEWRSRCLSPPGHHAARRSSDRHPKGWESCRLHCHPGDPILQVTVPNPGGLRPNRPCRTATDHLWWHLRLSQAQILGQRRRVRQAGGGARASPADP